MDYLQITLTTERDNAEQISDVLEELDALSITIESACMDDVFDAALPGDPRWKEQQVLALFSAETDRQELIDALAPWISESELAFSALEDRDWERAWLDQFQPTRINDRLWVVPSWHEPPDGNALNLVIDPGLAFGTGTHPTTRICLDYISGLELSDKCVIDYGCGSGILAIAAVALGSTQVFATDLDPRALDATRANAEVNGCGDRLKCMTLEELDNTATSTADVLVANILAATIEEIRDRLVALLKPGGMLILSGILNEQVERIVLRYRSIVEFSQHENDGWVLLAGSVSGGRHDSHLPI